MIRTLDVVHINYLTNAYEEATKHTSVIQPPHMTRTGAESFGSDSHMHQALSSHLLLF